MPQYAVSPDELRALSLGLRRAQDVVRGLPGEADGFTAALGSAVVARAVAHASQDWTRARARIDQGLAALAEGALAAARGYAEADRAAVVVQGSEAS